MDAAANPLNAPLLTHRFVSLGTTKPRSHLKILNAQLSVYLMVFFMSLASNSREHVTIMFISSTDFILFFKFAF